MVNGKSVLVTGSTSGIGLGVARAFAEDGANLMLNGFGDPDQIEAIRRAIETDFGVKASYNGADLSDPDACMQLVASTREELGGIDVLVNNAGIQHVAKIEDFPGPTWEKIISINLSAVFYTTKAALPSMYGQNWGRIINVASAHGLTASAQKGAYVAAKHGVVGFTKVTALESARTPITCNAICPGWVLTPLVEKQINDRASANSTSFDIEKAKLLDEKQPSGEFVTPEQIGGLAVFLSSPAADQIRGQPYAIDGGWTAQ